jgi:hypothetical protein
MGSDLGIGLVSARGLAWREGMLGCLAGGASEFRFLACARGPSVSEESNMRYPVADSGPFDGVVVRVLVSGLLRGAGLESRLPKGSRAWAMCWALSNRIEGFFWRAWMITAARFGGSPGAWSRGSGGGFLMTSTMRVA